MNSNKLTYLLLVILSCGMMACQSGKIATEGRFQKKGTTFLMEKIAENKVPFEWFGSKAKIKFRRGEEQLSATTAIRMRYDSIIWITIKKVNIEGARILITPNLIEVLDRQNSTYIRKPFSSLKEEYGVDINFLQLQELILGNAILYNQELNAGVEGRRNVLRTPKNAKDVLKLFFKHETFLLHEMRISQNSDAVRIAYDDYQEVEGKKMAFRKSIEIDSETQGQAEMDLIFSKIELNIPQKVRFNVPDSYQKQ
jgi:hypothetical protein